MKTAEGKDVALRALHARRVLNKTRERVDQSRLPAGSPIILDCVACGTGVSHPENYLTRRFLCCECDALKACGWLE